MTTSLRPYEIFIILICLLIPAGLFMWFFSQIETEGTTLAIDWVHYAIKDGNITYQITDGLRNPPWSLIPVLPLGFLPERAGWGMLVYINMLVLVASVPFTTQRRRFVLAVLCVVTSYPSLRTSVDANFEILVSMGALLLIPGYTRRNPYLLAAGLLIITAKPQSVSLLLPAVAYYMLFTWERADWIKAAALVLAVVIPMMLWRGEDWIQAVQGTYQRGSIIDMSLDAALLRTGVVPEGVRMLARLMVAGLTLYVAWIAQHTLSRDKAAMLITASLIVAPYAAGNSILAIVAVGIAPLLVRDPRWGYLMLVIVNLNYPIIAVDRYMLGDSAAYLWTAELFMLWGLFMWRVYQAEIMPAPHPETEGWLVAG